MRKKTKIEYLDTKIGYNRIWKALQHYRSARAVALLFKVSHPTLREYCRLKGIPIPDRVEALKNSISGRALSKSSATGAVGRFFQNCRGQQVPRSPAAIAKLVGCSPQAVASYLYRRRRDTKKTFEILPDLRRYTIPLIDTKGNVFTSKSLKAYGYNLDKYTLEASILCQFFSGETTRVELWSPATFARHVRGIVNDMRPQISGFDWHRVTNVGKMPTAISVVNYLFKVRKQDDVEKLIRTFTYDPQVQALFTYSQTVLPAIRVDHSELEHLSEQAMPEIHELKIDPTPG